MTNPQERLQYAAITSQQGKHWLTIRTNLRSLNREISPPLRAAILNAHRHGRIEEAALLALNSLAPKSPPHPPK